jgi:hypothetical protein
MADPSQPVPLVCAHDDQIDAFFPSHLNEVCIRTRPPFFDPHANAAQPKDSSNAPAKGTCLDLLAARQQFCDYR